LIVASASSVRLTTVTGIAFLVENCLAFVRPVTSILSVASA
jgi:hypothetical protein